MSEPSGGRISGTGSSRRSVTVIAMAVVLAFAACGGSSGNGSTAASGSSPKKSTTSSTENGGSGEETSTKTIAGQQVNFKKSADVSKKSSLEIEADDFYFSPTVLKGKPGQTMKLEVKNEGTVTHNFTLPSSHVSKNISPGQSIEVNVTFPQSGTALFHCAFHATSGMRGALEAS